MRLGNIAVGAEAWWFARFRATAQHGCVFVFSDFERAADCAEQMAFFAPDVRRYVFPAWDCMPFDFLEPKPFLVGERMRCLWRLLEDKPASSAFVVITTFSALLQRVPPPSFVRKNVLHLKTGTTFPTETLRRFLAENGYQRSHLVQQRGMYAWRGGIIDIYPSHGNMPVRIDLFGDTIESMRPFNPSDQRSQGHIDTLCLQGMREYCLDAATCQRFRQRYRQLESPHPLTHDSLYQSVSQGIDVAGLCHWLPLLHESLASFIDYLPADSEVFFERAVDASFATYWHHIDDYYAARLAVQQNQPAAHESCPPRLLSTQALYIDASAWQQRYQQHKQVIFSQLPVPAESDAIDAGCRPLHHVQQESAAQRLKHFHAYSRKHRLPLLFVARSPARTERLERFMREQGHTKVVRLPHFGSVQAENMAVATCVLAQGFITDDVMVVSEQDLFGVKDLAVTSHQADDQTTLQEGFSQGSLVVHRDHGIGRYEGLMTVDVGGVDHDCLAVRYDKGDRLLVPVENIAFLSHYGREEGVALDRLGQVNWQLRKARVKKRLQSLTAQLVKTAAQRQLATATVMKGDGGGYEAFCAGFPFTETRAQQQAINDVMTDLQQGVPMDRLLCGDTGFGKTEVALRAAFIVACEGYQIAVLAPTTLLARQHEDVFRQRFRNTPYRIAMLSRLTSKKQAERIRTQMKDGTITIVIGTQSLLRRSLVFANLGLVIFDEEHHFGVKQKEAFKETYHHVHTLTLTATPIPRTLQMSLAGLRALSIITTPPVDRQRVHSFVMPFDPVVVQKALLREHERGGLSFYVTARIRDIERIEHFLRSSVPHLRLGIAHGRLSSQRLNHIMEDFYDGKLDILLSTSIIESGLDIPLANTLIVDRADLFGLAQLYQLRGRVGRSHRSSWAYFTWQRGTLQDVVEKRLQILARLQNVGGGLSIATHDLDLRGGGNLLGHEQSGHMKEVGQELYMQMVQEAVTALHKKTQGQKEEASLALKDIRLHLGVPLLIPPSYIHDLPLRLALYRRLGSLDNEDAIDAFADEMTDRFGTPPKQCAYLLDVMRIKILCRAAQVIQLDAGAKAVRCRFYNNRFSNVDGLLAWLAEKPKEISLRPDSQLILRADLSDMNRRIDQVTTWLRHLAELAVHVEPSRPAMGKNVILPAS